MARRRRPTRAERRRAERERLNAEARERGADVAEAAQRPRVARSRHQLEQLSAQAVISVEQARAGARFFLDFIAGGSMTTLRMPLYQPGPRPPKRHRPPPPDSPARDAARLRFELAQAVLDPLEHAVVFHVAICDLPLAAWSPAIGQRRDPPLQLLRQALSTLTLHYERQRHGLSEVAPHRQGVAA